MNGGFFVDNSWKLKWKDRKMDQEAREEKRAIKKRNHKSNRRFGKIALRNNDVDNLDFWKVLDEKDK